MAERNRKLEKISGEVSIKGAITKPDLVGVGEDGPEKVKPPKESEVSRLIRERETRPL